MSIEKLLTCCATCRLSLLASVIILALIIFTSCAILPDSNHGQSSVVQQDTPENAVLSYYQAFDNGDVGQMRQLLDVADESNQLFLSGFEMSLQAGERFQTSEIRIFVVEDKDDKVRIRTNYHSNWYILDELVASEKTGGIYTLVKKKGKWYFIGLGDSIPPGWILDASTPVLYVTPTPK